MFFFLMLCLPSLSSFFFFNDTATTEIYTLSLHDALPISQSNDEGGANYYLTGITAYDKDGQDRKSTRLNSSHQIISYAVFCLKKKKSWKDEIVKTGRARA